MTKVKQIGHPDGCARTACTSTPMFRVILGHFQIQAYVCSVHVPWAVRLDMLSQNTGESLGWVHGYPVGSMTELRYATVDPLMPTIKRVNYGRDESVNIASSFPVYREPDGIPYFRPIGD